MNLKDFSYELPEERIAQAPAEPRDASRLLVLDRGSGELTDAQFRDLPRFLSPGDLLVANDTRVVPARLRGRKETGAKLEVLLLEREAQDRWEALVRPAKRVRPGTVLALAPGVALRVLEERGEGVCAVRLETDPSELPEGPVDVDRLLERLGEVPLPPYIRREGADERDRERYQTLFARAEKGGSAAAPTAGLHFTERVLGELRAAGIECVTITLHVGLGTFLPVRVEDVRGHRMHRERYELTPETADAVKRALSEGRRVVAVGTTAARVLEHCGREGALEPGTGWTELFLLPGHRFRIVGGLLTNFHLPESTLLMLACAFGGGTDRVLAAYRHAVAAGYRFYSYGDAMLMV
ncbi:MAG: tRNA preQ1(34) S-adenosylmethionine ribosyltransferase-isomerase QueA [Deltaproteobacteria bacterium]|nr:tRNA preQ1(34) S-adenosylmethionine ribosyltransferase-isomerase QueA [Deltaproteobacteria bacterium]